MGPHFRIAYVLSSSFLSLPLTLRRANANDIVTVDGKPQSPPLHFDSEQRIEAWHVGRAGKNCKYLFLLPTLLNDKIIGV